MTSKEVSKWSQQDVTVASMRYYDVLGEVLQLHKSCYGVVNEVLQ